MKPNNAAHRALLVALNATLAAAIVSPVAAQTHFKFHPLALAPAEASSSGEGGEGDEDNESKNAELAKKLQNPVASLIQVPIQNNWDFGYGSANAMRYTANVQPVIPFSLITVPPYAPPKSSHPSSIR